MSDDLIDFKDSHYAKKNKKLCIYCSYKCAVPSKNNQFCSEICRLLHLSVSKELNVEDIGKLIKLSKVDLIHIILNLKCQNISIESLHKILDKPYEYKQKILVKNQGSFLIDFS